MKKKKSNAEKEITRDERFEIRMSKEEKELWLEFSKDMGVNPTRLARNVLTLMAEKKLRNKLVYKPLLQAHRKYLEVTKQFDILERMKKE